jgi:hypothetical protein
VQQRVGTGTCALSASVNLPQGTTLPNLGGKSYPRETPMGVKWTARLRVDFELEDGAPANLAETCLRVAVGEFRRHIETGVIDAGKIGVKRGSAKVVIVAQGPTT